MGTQTLYKVVDRRLCSWWDRETRWRVGETVTHPNPSLGKASCGRGLHACFQVADTLQFRMGGWPCRLLEVSARTEDIIAQDETKARCRALTVVQELPIECAFGPGGKAVLDLVAEIGGYPWLRPSGPVTADDLQPLVDEYLRRLSRFRPGVGPLPVRPIPVPRACVAGTAAQIRYGDLGLLPVYNATDDAKLAAIEAICRAGARRSAPMLAVASLASSQLPMRAWNAEWLVITAASYRLVSDLVDWPSPWEPLLAVWRLGCLPCGVVDGKFSVVVPVAD
jgi:hypothetical protein